MLYISGSVPVISSEMINVWDKLSAKEITEEKDHLAHHFLLR
jgi:hypothetical protein